MKNQDKLPGAAAAGASAREARRVFGIMAEFVEPAERLAGIRPALSVLG
ncbi:MAG: TIGR00730 family Rossman fold protein, partial [Betaproteobacteria bacterium]|nr:TIGR00730 family Rossman fold protein [Betaproteobacteria bacterium]